MEDEVLLELAAASKSYRRAGRTVQALQALSLRIAGGELIGLLGPNGSGKTTVIKLLTGLVEADAGTLLWRGRPVPGRRHLGEIGVLLEGRGAGYERLSTLENAHYFCGLREARFERTHFDTLAELLAIPDIHAPLRQLSTGNKLRAHLLSVLIHRPALVLLDEPTLGLDLFGVDRLAALLGHAAEQGTACLLGSHDLHFIERICPRIVCLRAGRKVFDGPRSDFLHLEHGLQLIVQPGPAGLPALPPELFEPSGPRAWLAEAPSEGRAPRWQLPLRDHAEACRVLAALQQPLAASLGMELRQVSLRDKYLQLVGAGSTDSHTEAKP